MPPRSTSYGKCFLCGATLAKNAVSRHLKTCLPAYELGKGKQERLLHIRVEGVYAPMYWLDLAIPASATLARLDDYLRAIWLECCGHLSAFEIEGIRYETATEGPDFSFYDVRPRAMKSAKLEKVLQPGLTFLHEYDFGSTTELKLKVVGERIGLPLADKRKVRLLARNYAPEYRCKVCGETADTFYIYEYPYDAYCEEHSLELETGEESLMPIVNSPRTGECGYIGPYDESLEFEETMPMLLDNPE